MFRRLSLALAIAAALAPMAAYPLGLGEIHPKSYLNQAFSADIDLLSVDPDELDTVRVELAAPEVFQRAGVPRPFFLSKLEFTPVATPDGKAIIRVRSRDLIREPFLNFMIEVNWPKGRAVKEYTVLLDPPVVSQRRPKPVTAPSLAARQPAKPRGAPAVATTPAAATGALEYGPTRPNDTLWSIAKGMGIEGASVEQVLMALYRYNPNAFIGNNVNRLKVGQVLRLPGADAALEQSRSEARQAFLEHGEVWRAETQMEEAAPAALGTTDDESGPLPLETPDAAAETPTPPTLDKPELKLLGTDDVTAQVGSQGDAGEAESAVEGEPQREAGSLDQELLLAREEAAVARQEAVEMRGRIGELEEQLGEMQHLMTVQNDRLAQLQAQAEEAAKQPEPVVTPPEPKGFMERLTSGDTVVLGLLGAVGALLLGLIALLVRGRKREAAAYAAPTTVPPKPMPDTEDLDLVGDDSRQAVAAAAAVAPVADTVASVAPAPEPEPEPEPASAPAEESEPALDSLAEVDVYVAYGRYEQAEEMLREEIARHPERLEYQHKLLEVYAEAGNSEAFVAQAEKMSQEGAEYQDPQAWSRVMERGRALAPGSALFGGAAAAPGAGSEEAEESESEAANHFDFDLDLDLAGAAEAEPEAAPASEPPVQAVADNLDFEVGEFDFETSERAEPEAAQPEPSFVAGTPEPEVTEEAFEGLSLDEVGGLMEIPEESAKKPEEPEEPEELSLETDVFVGGDEEEVETKIDLALAYQDMGDPDDARIILEEVLREGNEDQQQRARELLQALS